MPTCSIASARFLTAGSATLIWLLPLRWISGSATPIWLTRFWMTSIARSSASCVITGFALVGLAS